MLQTFHERVCHYCLKMHVNHVFKNFTYLNNQDAYGLYLKMRLKTVFFIRDASFFSLQISYLF